MKILNTTAIVLLITFTLVLSCSVTENNEAGGTATEKFAGEWVVNVIRDGNAFGKTNIATYNTAKNTNTEMWLDDLENTWGLKTKVNLEANTYMFFGNNLPEVYFDITVNITNGIVIKEGTVAPSGAVVDSIYFNAEFSDIPGEIWQYSGYKRTGFLEDE